MPRKHLTRHLCGLISRSGGGIHEDLGTVRGDRYLIAEAAAQGSDKRLLAGLRQLRRVIIERAEDGAVTATGGKHRCYDPWRLDDGTLTPVGFRYQVPASLAEDA